MKIKEIYGTIRGAVTNRWTLMSLVMLLVTLFSVWYGVWWSLIISLPLIYDYYISRRIRGFHHRLMERYRWWRIAWAVWCAMVFALVVGILVHMLIFRWNTPFLLTFGVVLAYALWNELKVNTKTYKWLYGWVHAILFATVVATLVQLYWFQMFVIPTGSMEGTLLAGDYILVDKVCYGPRVPMTPLSFPFVHNTMPMNPEKASFSTAWERSYRRLAGTGQVERGDVVVFNFPEGDTVIMEMPEMDYYQLLHNSSNEYDVLRRGRDVKERREDILSRYTIAVRPLDKKENYIKRCVGMPGDTLQVVAGKVVCNGVMEGFIPQRQYHYQNIKSGGRRLITDAEMERMDASTWTLAHDYAGSCALIPHNPLSRWTLDDFGPVWVPKAGMTIALTPENIEMYGRCITVYEHRSLRQEQEGGVTAYYVDGQRATHYTFLMDYYFMMGDNRHESLDSRFWGFVPEDHIVGKAKYIWFSKDPISGDIRWDRMFTSIE